MSRVLALTIRNPHASLILSNFKKIEYRTWKTNYRGTLYIHVGKKRDIVDLPPHIARDSLFIRLNSCQEAILGSVLLTDCRPSQEEDSPYALCAVKKGGFSWMVENPLILASPIIIPGKLGLFQVEVDDRPRVVHGK